MFYGENLFCRQSRETCESGLRSRRSRGVFIVYISLSEGLLPEPTSQSARRPSPPGEFHEWSGRYGNTMATKRSIVDNANPGIASPPCAWSIQMGQCSAARTPPRAVRPSRWRDHEAARSNRRESPGSVPVTSQWCAQDGAGQTARTSWPPRRHPSRGSS